MRAVTDDDDDGDGDWDDAVVVVVVVVDDDDDDDDGDDDNDDDGNDNEIWNSTQKVLDTADTTLKLYRHTYIDIDSWGFRKLTVTESRSRLPLSSDPNLHNH